MVDRISKSFSEVRVLRNVSFTASAGEVLGLVGENGSGKSTCMNIVAGVLQPDSGRLLLDGTPYAPRNRREADAANIAFVQQELSIFPNLSVAENLFVTRLPRLLQALLIMSRRAMHARARDALRSVELDVNPAVAASTLSPGERQLLEIARGVSMDARVLILDEPTTSLTQREVRRLFGVIRRLRERGVAVIYVSHALEDVIELASRIVVMRDGSVTLDTPNSGIRPRDLVTAMIGRSIDTLFPARSPDRGAAAPVLEVDAVGTPGVVDGITFTVKRAEIVGLAGLMGSGRSELARILFGVDPHSAGTVRLAGRLLASGDIAARLAAGVAFLTEDRRHDGLMMAASVAENMALAALPMFVRRADGRVRDKILADALQVMARRLHLKSEDIRRTEVRTLSGGNQQKVVLGRWLLRGPSLFILDEPSRGVDVGARQEIYRTLAQMADDGMAILVISSDLEELIGLADRILVMRQGMLRAQFLRAEFDREKILEAAFGQENGA